MGFIFLDFGLFIMCTCISLDILIKFYWEFLWEALLLWQYRKKKIQCSQILNLENSLLIVFETLTFMSYSGMYL